jgi:aminoglycoside phosphotransferase family enzyme/predicted kinase
MSAPPHPASSSPAVAGQARLVAALQGQLQAMAGPGAVQCIETHISFVLLAGAHAYKIKKAVDLGFVDFRSLERREYYCREELRLNRRTAPELYLDVVPIGGSPEHPVLGAGGAAIEWALRMQAFDQDGLWDRLAARGALGAAHIDALVDALCRFHACAEVAAPESACGSPEHVRAPMADNLRVLGELCRGEAERAALARLGDWEVQAFQALRGTFVRRQHQGRVRDAHGDLHLGNVAQFRGRPLLFDCLEFSAALRWTDVMSDVAFMAMDLRSHHLPRLAQRFVNAYVERSGDADGLRVLRYYTVHRALVRAKVAALRARQLAAAQAGADAAAATRALVHYLQVGLQSIACARPTLMLTHGCSGSGKTVLTQSLLELSGALRFRADVERKRLFGLDALADSDAALKPRLYSAAAGQATQARLRELAATALQSGYPVILDATFLAREDRQRARELAAACGAQFVVIDFQARVETLRERVQRRQDDASEADLEVLEQQLARAAPLAPEELPEVVVFDAETPLDETRIAGRWAPLLRRLNGTGPTAAA